MRKLIWAELNECALGRLLRLGRSRQENENCFLRGVGTWSIVGSGKEGYAITFLTGCSVKLLSSEALEEVPCALPFFIKKLFVE